jgi:hypothetical protein
MAKVIAQAVAKSDSGLDATLTLTEQGITASCPENGKSVSIPFQPNDTPREKNETTELALKLATT